MVLLAVADKASGPDCRVRMGTTEFRARLNASRSVVQHAVDKALESGELVEVEAAVGSRSAMYELPFAVGYTRPSPGATGPESGPVADQQGPGIRAPNGNATGPESGPGGPGIRASRGPESGPLHQTTPTRSESQQAAPATPDTGTPIPPNARPLVDALTAAGVIVRWNLTTPEWFVLEALIKKTGIEALAAFAAKQAGSREISYARYFLPGWKELPPLPSPGAKPPTTPPPRRAPGYRPFQCPPASAYENDLGF